MTASTVELRLLLACARVVIAPPSEAAIRQMLESGIDWTLFARYATTNGLAALAGQTLGRVAPDLIPEEILDAFRALGDQTRRRNRALFDELAEVTEALERIGVAAIPLKGPILALQAFGDLGLRVFGGLDVLVRGHDVAATMAALQGLGYRRSAASATAQSGPGRPVRDHEIVFRESTGTAIEIHTRPTQATMRVDIDDDALWRRAQRASFNGRAMLALAPEDALLLLAIQGGDEMWRNIKGTCDVAAFVAAHPRLDWPAIVERAQAQACLRLLRLALALARDHFDCLVPAAAVAATQADATIQAIAARIVAGWDAGDPARDSALARDRLLLQDRRVRRARKSSAPTPRQAAPTASSSALPPLPPAETERHERACADAQRVLAGDPANGGAWRRLANALLALERCDEAIAAYDRAVLFAPDSMRLWKSRKAAFAAVGKKAQFPDAALNPQDAAAWAVRAGALWFSARFAEAAEASDRALELDPLHVAATRIGIHSRLQACDWRQRDQDKRRMRDGLERGTFMISDCAGLSESEEELRMSAQFTAPRLPASSQPLWQGELYRHERIRIAYLSTDFRAHAVASLIVGCFEHHDKTRFETTAVSLHPGDGSDLRKRIEGACDRIIAAPFLSDAAVAERLRELEIDIAIDLNGYTGEMRPGILARRPAAVQVSYLGYPGTMDVPFMDYIIADRVVIPEENQIYYSEKIAYLPHSYMPNDRNRRIAEKTPSRIQAELPETGFVFACFNNPYKFGPEMFAVWMRLLRAVEGSVLWLPSIYAEAIGNLRREAKAQDVAPERLIFAPRVAREEDYLARLRLADLFLDTLPYNAHATASDALWAGLPIVTLIGNAFPGRVAASLLSAVGLPELVTTSIGAYEEMARALALDPTRLAALKAKLMRNRDTEPLFDTARITRDLESAYATMWERQQAGLSPESFVVREERTVIRSLRK
jgi:predicted O-linked N-acetylglucosamine transferase (SPINDLY family)